MDNILTLTGNWQGDEFVTTVKQFKSSLKRVKMGTCKRGSNDYNFELNKSDLIVIDEHTFIPSYHIKKLLQVLEPEEVITMIPQKKIQTLTLIHGNSKTQLKSRNDFKVNTVWRLNLQDEKA